MKYLHLLWTSLFRKKMRTILTLLSVFVAFVLFGLLQAVQLSFAAGAQVADARRMLTTPRYGMSDSLPLAHLQQIEQVEGVVGVSYMIWFGGKYQDKEDAFGAFAVDPRRHLDMYPELVIEPEQREAFINTRTGAIVGRALLERYGWKLGQKLPIRSDIHAKNDGSMDWEFDLVGILDPRDATSGNVEQLVLINSAYFDEARRVDKGTVGWFTVRVNDSYRAQAAFTTSSCAPGRWSMLSFPPRLVRRSSPRCDMGPPDIFEVLRACEFDEVTRARYLRNE